jgi:hypothetical protein
MKRTPILVFAIATAVCVIASMLLRAGGAGAEASPIFGVKIPARYRQWEMVGVSHEAGNLDELRGILGNALAIKAFRDGTLFLPGWHDHRQAGLETRAVSRRRCGPGLDAGFRPRGRHDGSNHGQRLKEVRRDGWLGIRPVHRRQTCRRGATCNMLPLHQANAKGHDFVFTRYAP